MSSDATDSTAQIGAQPAGSCGECGAPHAHDQRYCLECGAPLATALLPDQAASTADTQILPVTPPSSPPAHLIAGSASGHAPQPSPFGSPGGGNSAVTVIAGVGVLLLAMGVGVLIGRTGSSAPAPARAPQVVTLSAPTTSTTSTESSESGSASSKQGKGHHKGAGSKQAGSSPGRPAPPSVLTNLHKSGGGSYEQKSKNLPNVISTG